jgi:hypothetical protein
MLERNGKVLCVTGPVRPSEAKLRRAQALAAGNGLGLEIARTLIDAKLKGHYAGKIQPLLASTSASAIARQISVSRWYAGRIREGYRPHPRHWQALAKLVGVSADGQ